MKVYRSIMDSRLALQIINDSKVNLINTIPDQVTIIFRGKTEIYMRTANGNVYFFALQPQSEISPIKVFNKVSHKPNNIKTIFWPSEKEDFPDKKYYIPVPDNFRLSSERVAPFSSIWITNAFL